MLFWVATLLVMFVGGCFICNPGPLACRGITFDSVNLQVDKGLLLYIDTPANLALPPQERRCDGR